MIKQLKHVTLSRIIKNFDRIEEDYRGGHIAILFRFSQNRNTNFEFTEREKLLKRTWRIVEKGNMGDWDGEVQFEYGEKFYHFRKIVVEG